MYASHIPGYAYAAASFSITLRHWIVVLHESTKPGDVRAVNHQMWVLTIIAAVLYGVILRDIAGEVRGE
jgi:hypothetical protein